MNSQEFTQEVQESKTTEVVDQVVDQVSESTEIPSEVPDVPADVATEEPEADKQEPKDEEENEEEPEKKMFVGALEATVESDEPITGTVVVSPQNLRDSCSNMKCTRVFLAGTIANGDAPDWQTDVANRLTDLPVYVLNPRRADWNPDADTEAKKAQIDWEFEGQLNSHVIIYNFVPGYQSPVTLLELGMFSRSNNRIIVCCPQNYDYFLNVDFLCKNLEIPIFENIDDAVEKARSDIKEHNAKLVEKIKREKEMMKKLFGSISGGGGKISGADLMMLMSLMGGGGCCEHGHSHDHDHDEEGDDEDKEDNEDKEEGDDDDVPPLEGTEQGEEDNKPTDNKAEESGSGFKDTILKAIFGGMLRKPEAGEKCVGCGDECEKDQCEKDESKGEAAGATEDGDKKVKKTTVDVFVMKLQ
jgi:hypothetical protein